MAPGTLYRRALRRVDRRRADYHGALEAVRLGYLTDADYHRQLLHEAVRTANRLAYCAGIPDRREFAPRWRDRA